MYCIMYRVLLQQSDMTELMTCGSVSESD